MKDNQPQVTIRVTKDLRTAVKVKAAQNETSTAEVIRSLLEEWVAAPEPPSAEE